MKIPKHEVRTVLLSAILVVAFGSEAVSQEIEEEIFEANAVQMGNIATGATFSVQVRVRRWSTPEERVALLTILRDQGQEAARDALADQEETGSVRVGTRLPWPLRYAREVELEGGGRRIIMATDRPIEIIESFRRGRSLDYTFSLVQLDLDAENRGEGVLIVGAELDLDPETNTLTIESADVEGVRLNNVFTRD